MQALSKDTPTVEHYGTIFIALELSQRSWLVFPVLPGPGQDIAP